MDAHRFLGLSEDQIAKDYGFSLTKVRAVLRTSERGDTMRSSELVEYIQTHPGVTWAQLEERFGKKGTYLVETLKRVNRLSLIERVDACSGTRRRVPYSDTLVSVLESQPDLTWREIGAMFGKTEIQLRSTLAYKDRRDLARGRRKK